jgi:hypothetical protein
MKTYETKLFKNAKYGPQMHSFPGTSQQPNSPQTSAPVESEAAKGMQQVRQLMQTNPQAALDMLYKQVLPKASYEEQMQVNQLAKEIKSLMPKKPGFLGRMLHR